VEQLRREQPTAEIYLLAVTPTPSRYVHWPRIQQTNRELRSIAQNLKGVHYIPTSYAFLDADGEPKAGYFVEDKLHLNAAGYRVWAELIKRSLEMSELSEER
jgi:lysophospholipase L1-like esterase